MVLENAKDSQMLTSLLQFTNAVPDQNHILEISLDLSKANEFDEFHLAIALNSLYPHPNSSNPHNLQAIKLAVKGNVLYTRYNYQLASPALSKNVDMQLSRLANSSLTEQEKSSLAHKVTSTEKIVAKALLGIRGVKKVFIAGTGKTEGEFAEVLKHTLIQPPGTDITTPVGEPMPDSTLQLFSKGVAELAAYRAKAIHHSATTKGTFKPYPHNPPQTGTISRLSARTIATSSTRRRCCLVTGSTCPKKKPSFLRSTLLQICVVVASPGSLLSIVTVLTADEHDLQLTCQRQRFKGAVERRS
jgi:hypothetical protein